MDFELVDGTTLEDSAVLDLLEMGYGRPFRSDWLHWKHHDSPWGASRCVVARDDDGLLGVVFGLPWRFRIDGEVVDGMRLVDGATGPRSQRRGVFRAICNELVYPSDGRETPALVIATATPAAQAAHVKNGAVAVDPITFAYRPARWSRRSVSTSPAILDGYVPPAIRPVASSAWDAQALRWRLDPRSGINYSVSCLADADDRHGVVHRTTSQKGLRVLIVTMCWGQPTTVSTVVRAVARRERAVIVLGPVGPGTSTPASRLEVRRGSSLLCVWDRTGQAVNLAQRSNWSLDGTELEGVI